MKRFFGCVFLVIATSVFGFSQDVNEKANFLLGKWKMGGKSYYEVWHENKEGELVGETYSIDNGKKMTSKKLLIKNKKKGMIYEIVYPKQRKRSVEFLLNENIDGQLLFEAQKRHALAKISYERESDKKIVVHVTEPDGKGFSYYMIKQFPRRY